MLQTPSPAGEPDEWLAVIELLTQAGKLKRLCRQGWLDRGVRDPESVAGHSWRMALMALLVSRSKPELNLSRLLMLAIVHDLPEAIAGDATPFDERIRQGADPQALFRQAPAYSPEARTAKERVETAAMERLTVRLPADLAELISGAWQEYEANQTPEARLIHQIDKLETWLQAVEYQIEQPGLLIESFRLGTDAAVTDPDLRRLMRAINALKPLSRSPG